jgi:8-hydroxy-5-deazaflavin:NADPH oxidoreductase
VAGREQLVQAGRTVTVIGGTGALGFGLALRWSLAGIPVVIGSRSEERADQAATKLLERAKEAGAEDLEISGAGNEEAAKRARTVVLAVPFSVQSENLSNLRYALQPGTVLVDATVPLATAIGGRGTRTVGIWQGSAAQQAQEMAPRGVAVVSALHTVSATLLSDPEKAIDEDVLLAGDDRKAKEQVAELVARIPGLRPVDCGDLEVARIIEQLTALLISVNKRHKIKHSGIRITGIPAERAADEPADD